MELSHNNFLNTKKSEHPNLAVEKLQNIYSLIILLSKQKLLIIQILILIFLKGTKIQDFLKFRSHPHNIPPSHFVLTNLEAMITHLKSTAALGFQQKVRNSVIQYWHHIW